MYITSIGKRFNSASSEVRSKSFYSKVIHFQQGHYTSILFIIQIHEPLLSVPKWQSKRCIEKEGTNSKRT